MYRDAPAGRPGNFNLNFDDYTYPVYYVHDGARDFPVMLRHPDWGGNVHGGTMPWDPAWTENEGSDGQVIVLDEVDGREWNGRDLPQHDMHRLRRSPTTARFDWTRRVTQAGLFCGGRP